jgi:hypothetical protein
MHERRHRDGVRRVDEAGDDVDLLLDDQLLDDGLGRGAARILVVALHHLDRVGLERVRVHLEEEVDAAVDLLAKLGADAAVGQRHADLHFLSRRAGANQGQSRGGRGDTHLHVFPALRMLVIPPKRVRAYVGVPRKPA